MPDSPAPGERPLPRPSDTSDTSDTEATAKAADATGSADVRGVLARLGMTDTSGTLLELMGITLVQASGERVVGTMRVAGNTQMHGLLHGGASVVLAETLGSVGAALVAGPNRTAVGVDINATHHRAVRPSDDQEVVTGTASVLHAGRTSASFEVVVTDVQSRRVCTARITCQLRDAPPR